MNPRRALVLSWLVGLLSYGLFASKSSTTMMYIAIATSVGLWGYSSRELPLLGRLTGAVVVGGALKLSAELPDWLLTPKTALGDNGGIGLNILALMLIFLLPYVAIVIAWKVMEHTFSIQKLEK